ncbi:uncharacterized protein VTP21DRAFT_441 [Calcarisporiella thermophila]|uniref:uncharacterized protein n=1 Tax=Calcarisporiella thermophila TaxID=911321 RepID=UPI003743B709
MLVNIPNITPTQLLPCQAPTLLEGKAEPSKHPCYAAQVSSGCAGASLLSLATFAADWSHRRRPCGCDSFPRVAKFR